MNHLVYQYSLCAALSLMTFFSLYFLLTRTPEKPIFKDYFRSRRIMGTALLVCRQTMQFICSVVSVLSIIMRPY